MGIRKRSRNHEPARKNTNHVGWCFLMPAMAQRRNCNGAADYLSLTTAAAAAAAAAA
jgi:hypothetical protein